MPVMAVAKFERFFRAAAGVDVDKNELKRYTDCVNDKIYDLLIMGQAGFLDHDETVKGMTLFSREVYPRLKELGVSA